MKTLKAIIGAWQQTNLMLRIFVGIVAGSVLALTVPGISAISLLGVSPSPRIRNSRSL